MLVGPYRPNPFVNSGAMIEEIVPLTLATDESVASDCALLAQFRTGREDAAQHIYDRYASRLRQLAEQHCKTGYERRFDAEDIVQSVFRIFFHGVRYQGYDAPPDGEIWGLLTVLALNKVKGKIEHHRAAKRDLDRTRSMSGDTPPPAMDSDEIALSFLKMVIDEHLASYPDQHREIVRLRLEGYEIGEIANLSKRSSRTVERILLEFRTKIADAA